MNRLALFLAHLIIAAPKRVIACLLLLPLLLSPGLQHIKFNDDYRVYFSKDNVDLVAWENLLDTYSRTDPLIVTVEATQGADLFSPEIMEAVQRLTEELWQVDFVTRVDSIANFQHIEADAEEILVEDLILPEKLRNPGYLSSRRAIAENEPRIKDRMLSPDGKVTAIYLQLMIPDKENAIAEAAAKVRSIRDDYELRYANIDIRLGGIVMLNAAFDEYARADMATLFPLMFLIFMIIMALLFRSWKVTLCIVFSTILTVFSAFGVTGFLGIEFSPHSSIAPHVILTISVAVGIHVALSFLFGRARYPNRDEAVKHTLQQNIYPVTLTSLTTGIGFLSMLYSDVPPFQHLGVMCALGVLFAYINSMVLIPASMMLMNIQRDQSATSAISHVCKALGEFLVRRKALAAVVFLGLMAAPMYGLRYFTIDDHPVKMFEKGTEFRDDADFIDERLAGTTTIHFSLDTGVEQGISDPVFLREAEAFQQHLLDDPMINHVTSLTDTLKRVNKSLHNGDQAFYKTADSQEANAQALLFYEANLPFGQEINNEINIAKSSTRMIATIASSSSSEIIHLVDRTHQWLQDNVQSFQSRGVSVLVMFSYMIERLADNMIINAALATVLIGLVLTLTLGSVRLGLISMAPNLAPILVAFGFWSLFGGSLDFAAVLIFAMTLGVVVDDTVHFISKYLRLTRDQGMSPNEAVVETFRSIGPALLISTVVLSVGFLAFSLSHFHMNVTLGIMSSLTFLIALIFDFIMLPLLLLAFGPKPKPVTEPLKNTVAA
ncbi:predicted exporters of the RND superfamily [Hahella chejuensis KCTC 2396]|uniref:Predicted exporters of the RND superfamily n=1 Tax=Hahella chejuensis (strain KCTC 2396) TaxID=349521 RepID=Q2SJ80_HAHCH|nr:efflux RND transporter permease subunit [Hahella chejuensis]ABC29294.1 predicted exporters of the RND superfamily [Hahella chejuensis KCTC 2396]